MDEDTPEDMMAQHAAAQYIAAVLLMAKGRQMPAFFMTLCPHERADAIRALEAFGGQALPPIAIQALLVRPDIVAKSVEKHEKLGKSLDNLAFIATKLMQEWEKEI